MKLLILESGAKARTVKKYLGKGWMVEACSGHIQDLPQGGGKKRSKAMWASENGNLPEPPWEWTEGAERVIAKILNKAADSDVEEVYLATDPDREGEFIAWRLSILFSEFPVLKRVTFNEITKTAVNDAIENPGDINMDLVDAAKVRRFMDRLVGFRCSGFSKSWNLKSMGRVQTPTLGFIVQRELEREAHVPIEFHTVQVESDGIRFNVRFHEKDDLDAWTDDSGKHHSNRTSDGKLAADALEALQEAGQITITSVNEGKTNRNPQPPFTTDTLLQAANSTLGWPVSKTGRIASALYHAGHITYIRTDSTRTNSDARNKIRNHIKEEYGESHLGPGMLGSDAKKGASNIQDAHEAIRPTRPVNTSISEADSDWKSLYGLIWARFAASQMSASVRERRDLQASVEGTDRALNGTASWRTHPGWEAVYTQFHGEVRTSPPDSPLTDGAVWKIDGSEDNPFMKTDETKPPRRFSESSIIQQMKKAGIGRPSTYVSIVKNLGNKGYVDVERNSLTPTEKGRTLWLQVVPFFNEQYETDGLFTPQFTSKMEESLDRIEHAKMSGANVWNGFVGEFRAMHNIALEERRKVPTLRQLALLENRIPHLDEARRKELLSGKELGDLTGEEARRIIESITDANNENGFLPASDKQTALIVKLSDQTGMDLDETLRLVGSTDISELTGGRDGTASELISALIEKSRNMPATPAQVDLVNKLADQHEMPINEVLAIAGLREIDEMTKSDASDIINEMKKRARRRGKRRSGA